MNVTQRIIVVGVVEVRISSILTYYANVSGHVHIGAASCAAEDAASSKSKWIYKSVLLGIICAPGGYC